MTMQNLKLADDLFPDVGSGKKHVTIRAGRRDIWPGVLRFETTSGNPVDGINYYNVDVCRVTVALVRDLKKADAQLDGFKNVDALLVGLQRFYPDMTNDSLVTIIKWLHK